MVGNPFILTKGILAFLGLTRIPFRLLTSNMISALILMAIAGVLAISTTISSGQITTACTNSLISSFTPCLNFITGSTNGGGSPTSDCCEALGSFLSGSSECACLIFTGNVPISLPINRTLAISLPRVCKNKAVPLQCKATGTPLPSPGPVTYAPGLPPLPPFSGSGSNSVSPSSSQTIEPAASPTRQQGLNQGQRPVVVPSSAAKMSLLSLSSILMLLVLGTFAYC